METLASFFAINELAFVSSAVLPVKDTLAMSLVISLFAFILFAFWIISVGLLCDIKVIFAN